MTCTSRKLVERVEDTIARPSGPSVSSIGSGDLGHTQFYVLRLLPIPPRERGVFEGQNTYIYGSNGSHDKDIQRNCGHRECEVEDLSQTVEAR